MNDLRRYNRYVQNAIDVCALLVSLFLVRLIAFSMVSVTGATYLQEPYETLFMVTIGAYILVNVFVMLHDDFTLNTPWENVRAAVKMVACVVAALAVYFFFAKVSVDYSRIFIAVFAVVSTVLDSLLRIIAKRVVLPLYRRSSLAESLLIIGTRAQAEQAVRRITRSGDWRLSIRGLIITDGAQRGEQLQGCEVLGSGEDMAEVLRDSDADSCLVLPDPSPEKTAEWLETVFRLGKAAHVDIEEYHLMDKGNRRLDKLGECAVVSYLPVLRMSRRQILLKRVLDVLCSIALLPLLLVLSGITALVYRCTAPGPVLTRRVRVGVSGRRYYQHRFRTLRMDAEARIDAGHTPCTGWGRFLRRTHLDGLPELLDVLSGEMGLLGPKSPTLPEYLDYAPEQRANLCIRPGVLGFWSCRDDAALAEEERAYVERWNLFKDLRILAQTAGRYLSGCSLRDRDPFAQQALLSEEIALLAEHSAFRRPLEYAPADEVPDTGREKGYRLAKRCFDIAASLAGIILSSPVMLVLALLVMLEDGGAPFYAHERIGYRGRRIRVYKFRSMRQDAGDLEKLLTPEQLEQYRKEFKIDNDPRVTHIGGCLRKTSLDELPQLFNILSGSLSLVGPRPIVEKETEYYGSDLGRLLSVKPGLTGYWQAYARNNATYASGERQQMELYYVAHHSLGMDLRILLKTVTAVIRREGAK